MMLAMDDFQFRAVQRRTPALAAIPVIVLSAFPSNVETSAASNTAAYLRKPVRLDRRIATIERYYAR